MYLPDSVYSGVEQTQEFYNKRFFLHYKDFLDLERLRDDKEGYREDIRRISKLVKDVDFNKNLLFISSKDISKILFLIGFSKLDRLSSFRYMTILDLIDVRRGFRTFENGNLPEDLVMLSEQDIREDVFCLYCDEYMYMTMKSDMYVTSAIEGREQRRNRKGNKFLNWIFYRGDYETFKNDAGSCGILKYFHSKDKKDFRIVDFNVGNIGFTKDSPKISDGSNTNKTFEGKDIYSLL